MSEREGKVEIAPRFRLRAFDQITVGSERVYLVKGIIPRTSFVVVWGPPKCGKSFWIFDLVMHLALGWEYRGRRVQQGAVVYLALEGGQGFIARVEAFRQRYLSEAISDPVQFFLIVDAVNLVKDHGDLIGCIRAQAGPPAAVVIDTVNRSLAGSESDDRDMAAYIRAADAIRAAFDCAVIVVHHCGVDATRPRGHTSLGGAVDAQIAVKRDTAGNIVCTVECMKDGLEGATLASRLEVVAIGTDIDGDPITSCVIIPVEGAAARRPDVRKNRPPKSAQIALLALAEAIDEFGEQAPSSNHIPASSRVTTLRHWREYAYRRGISTGEDRALQKAFKQATEHLIAEGQVGVWDGYVWIARP